MLDVDAARSLERGRDRDRARPRRRRVRASRAIRCSGRSSATTRSSPRTTRPSGRTASSCASRRASSSRSRSTCASSTRSDGGALFWRLLVVAEEGSRFSFIEEYASETPDLAGYSNAVTELFVGGAKLEYVSIQNLSPETWHFASHRARVDRDAELDWVAGGFGSKKGKVRIENDLAGQGATSRVTGAYFADGDQHLDYDTLQEHLAPNTTSDFAFKGALRDHATAVWRGMIRSRGRAEDERLPGEPQPAPLRPGARRLDPGARDRGERRPLHARRDGQPGRPRRALLLHGPRLSRGEAERLIVRGFYQEIFDRIELEPVRDALQTALEARIPE